jgi:hypothetical protein
VRSEEKAASSSGVITVGGGYSLCAVPSLGAEWRTLTLKAERGGNPVQSLAYEPGRVLGMEKWDAATIEGAVPGALYRVLVGETIAERVGPLKREPVTLLYGKIGGEFADGTKYFNTFPTGGGEVQLGASAGEALIDVRTVGKLEFHIIAPPVAGYSTESIKVYLDCYNDAGDASSRGVIVLGNTTDAATAREKRVPRHFTYVQPKVVFADGPTELDGFMYFLMRAWPR